MQIVDLPLTTEDMRFSVSLTGLTYLKESRYKERHGGLKTIAQVPKKGFIITPRKKKQQKPKKKKPKIRWNNALTDKPPITKTGRIRQYRIHKKEVIHRIRNYVNAMKGEKLLYFWTITFPEGTNDNTAYVLLNKWLTRLRTEKMLKEYLWIAERQKNGTVHFHMVINRKMCVQKANKYMRASIMYCINDGSIEYDRTKAARYNGVDIAKDRKTKRVINFAKHKKQKALTNYLTKYVTKNDNTFQHLAWHSSREYSNLIISIRFTYPEIQASKIKQFIDHNNPLEGQYFIHYRWKYSPPADLLRYLSQINQYIQCTFN